MNYDLISGLFFLFILSFIPIIIGIVIIKILQKFVKINQQILLNLLFISETAVLFKFFFSLCETCDLGSSPLGYYLFYPVFVLPLIFFLNLTIFLSSSNKSIKVFLILHFILTLAIPTISQRFSIIQSLGLVLLVLFPQILTVIKSKITLIKTLFKR